MAKKTVEDVIEFILANAPTNNIVSKRNKFPISRFEYNLVELAIKELQDSKKFTDLEAFDLRGTRFMWHTKEGITNFELARKGTKQVIKTKQKSSPKNSLEEILPKISGKTFHNEPINKYGTTLGGMLNSIYKDSPYTALMDLIDNDTELEEFRDLMPYDMKQSPINTWKDKDGNPNYELARKATKRLINSYRKENQNKSLEKILPEISSHEFENKKINKYQTTLTGMLSEVYEDSPYAALIDLINNDSELKDFRDFRPYDMKKSPVNTWKDKDGNPNYELAREATKKLIYIMKEENPEKKLSHIIKLITKKTFYEKPIDKYNAKLRWMLRIIYNESPFRALKNLAMHDKEIYPYLKTIESMKKNTKNP